MAFDPDLRNLLKALRRIASPFPRTPPSKSEREEEQGNDSEKDETPLGFKR